MKKNLGTIFLASLVFGLIAYASLPPGIGGGISRSDLFRRFFSWDSSDNVTATAAVSASGVTSSGTANAGGTGRGNFVATDNPALLQYGFYVDRTNSATRGVCLAGPTSGSCLNGLTVDGTTTATFSSSVASASGFSSSASSGTNAFGVLVNGARVDFGAGTNDYCSSDGTTISCGPLSTTQLDLTPTTTPPSVITDVAQISAFILDGGWPIMPTLTDPATGAAMPIGWTAGGVLMPSSGGLESWLANCHYVDTWAASTWENPAQANSSNGFIVTSGSQVGPQYDAGTWLGHQRFITYVQSSSTANSIIDGHMQMLHSTRGNLAHTGGFVWWARAALDSVTTPERIFFGLYASTATWPGGGATEPSNIPNSIYFGADPGQANMQVCSNDASNPATCTDLGSNYPASGGVAYEMWFFAPPNGSYVNYYIKRLPWYDGVDPGITPVAGRITSDLPQNTIQLATHIATNLADSGQANGMRTSFGPNCTWDNW